MSTDKYPHQFSNWAKERLDEIEATMTSIASRAGALNAEAKKQAEKAMSEIEAQRTAFQKAIREQQTRGETAWAAAKNELAPAWSAFEATVQHYLTEAGQQAEQQKATFKARAHAQSEAWQHTSEVLRGQAASYTAARKHDLDAALGVLKAEAEAAKRGLEKQQKAGEQSWGALKTALEEGRSAFDRAVNLAFEAFKKAA